MFNAKHNIIAYCWQFSFFHRIERRIVSTMQCQETKDKFSSQITAFFRVHLNQLISTIIDVVEVIATINYQIMIIVCPHGIITSITKVQLSIISDHNTALRRREASLAWELRTSRPYPELPYRHISSTGTGEAGTHTHRIRTGRH